MADVKKINSGLMEFSDEVKVFVAVDEDGKVEKAVTIDEDGKETNIGASPVTVESLTATENNTYNAGTGKAYNPVVVNVPQPAGKINITENGTDIDIAQYALADVAVPAPVSDFSTAIMTVANFPVLGGIAITAGCLANPQDEYYNIITDSLTMPNGEYKLPMYNGFGWFTPASNTGYVISGNAEYDNDTGAIGFTGDFTITYSTNP